MGLAERLGFTDVKVEGQWTPRNLFRRPAVQNSPDLERVLSLPFRQQPEEWALDAGLLKPPGPCRCKELRRSCVTKLYQTQRQALTEAAKFISVGKKGPRLGGLMGFIGVGAGKELLCELLPLVVPQCKVALLLIPAQMRDAFKLDWEFYGQHWKQPNLVGGSEFVPGRPRLKVIAYSELSHEKFTAALEALAPDLIIANEAHKFADQKSVRTGRLLSYAAAHPECRFVFVSGTLTKRSLKDYAHLSMMALREGSPLPIEDEVLEEWASAIDAPKKNGKLPALMGALEKLCLPGETVLEGFKRRRVCTPGVIDTVDASVPAALNVHRRDPPKMPEAVRKALAQVRSTGTRPDGEEFEDRARLAKCLRELAAGFYYRWIYPRGEPPELIERWFSARQAWHRELRQALQIPVPYMDSPKLLTRAAIRYYAGKRGTETHPVWPSGTFKEWRAVHKLVRPETQAVWVDDWLARDAVQWAKDHKGIVWYSHGAFGKKVAELGGLVRFGGGKRANKEILDERGDRPIVASISAHGEGKNLQYAFHENLLGELPLDSALYEQLFGRTHRAGQPEDEVDFWLYLHTPELYEEFEYARVLAQHVTTSAKQRLCLATYTFGHG